jgi:ArsR family transcriptional regulator, arsenate/arsenite/antimonite-responsive transcriptional repressor
MSIDVSPPPAAAPSGPVAGACCTPPTGLDPSLDAERLAVVAKALAEPIRVRLLDVLRRHGEPLCQCELRPLFDIAQPLLSHHMTKLVDAGLVEVERRHKWAYYSVRPDTLEELTAWLS